MKVNESTTDRIIRIVLGLVLGYLAYRHLGGTVATVVFAVLGVVSFVTGVTGFCLLYRVLGIQTCPVSKTS